MTGKNRDTSLFASPFSRGYWRCAAAEFRNLYSFILAALFAALRIAVKSLSIPVGESLYIGVDFLVNSVGSMIYGPLMGLLVGAVSDTVGAILFPKGPYFFPFIVVEILSAFLFGLFLYRQKLSAGRIVLSRFAVVVLCNFVVNPLIMKWYYTVVVGKDIAFLRWATVLKNLCLFPAEALLLVLWLSAVSSAAYRMGLVYAKPEKMNVKRAVFGIVLLTLLAAGGIALYYYLKASGRI